MRGGNGACGDAHLMAVDGLPGGAGGQGDGQGCQAQKEADQPGMAGLLATGWRDKAMAF